MLDAPKSLPGNPDKLRETAEGMLDLVKAQALKIAKLEHQLAGQKRHRFGAKSEGLDQLHLRLEEEETAAARVVPEAEPEGQGKAPKAVPKHKPLPPELPRVERVLTPGEVCACGGRLRRFAEDVTEELEYVPGRFVVNRVLRPRLACSTCERIVQSDLPSRPIERGRPAPGLLAHVLVSKYADHCPLYRQSGIYGREGIDLDRSTPEQPASDWTRVALPM